MVIKRASLKLLWWPSFGSKNDPKTHPSNQLLWASKVHHRADSLTLSLSRRSWLSLANCTTWWTVSAIWDNQVHRWCPQERCASVGEKQLNHVQWLERCTGRRLHVSKLWPKHRWSCLDPWAMPNVASFKCTLLLRESQWSGKTLWPSLELGWLLDLVAIIISIVPPWWPRVQPWISSSHLLNNPEVELLQDTAWAADREASSRTKNAECANIRRLTIAIHKMRLEFWHGHAVVWRCLQRGVCNEPLLLFSGINCLARTYLS